MDSGIDETDSNSSCHGQKNNHDQQPDRIRKLEDDFNLMRNYMKRNNRRIYSLFLKVTPASELLSGLLMEEGLLGTDDDGTTFDSMAKDSNFLDKMTAQERIDDNYKKIVGSIEDLRQLESMREELDTIGKTNSQQLAQVRYLEEELGLSVRVMDVEEDERSFYPLPPDDVRPPPKSLVGLQQEIREKDQQLKNVREELNKTSKTTSQQQARIKTWNRELGEQDLSSISFDDESLRKKKGTRWPELSGFHLLDTDCHETAFDSIAKDSSKITAQEQVDDKYKKIDCSLEDFHLETKEKEQQLKSVREEPRKTKVPETLCSKDSFDESIDDERNTNPRRMWQEEQMSKSSSQFKRFSDTALSRRSIYLMDNKEVLEQHNLPLDTYSYLAVAEYFTGCVPTYAFCMAMFVSCVQVATLAVFTLDVTNFTDGDNPMSIPAGVGGQVRASQVVALIISCWNQGEISNSFNVFSLGYDKEKARAMGHSATCFKWYFSAVLRIIIGFLVLLVTFALIVTSETVKGVMLNFASVTFLSELDHANFRLSLWGYFGKTVQQLAVKIKKTAIFVGKPTGILMKVPRLAGMFIIVCAFIVPWAIITARQERGGFMDHTIFVQFGDGFSPSIGAFSGLYRIGLDNSLDGIRVNYVEHQSQRQRATFSYCKQDSTWVFQYGPNREQNYPENLDYSGCWSRARSSQTENLDITRTSEHTWFVLDEDMMLEMPLQHVYMSGRSNYYGEHCESSRECGERMYCEEDIGECICIDGLFGLNCEFPEPCETLEIDTRDPNGGFYGTRSWSRRYSVIQEDGKKGPLQVYGKPVYLGGDLTEGSFDVMIFTGRRWILTDKESIEDYYPSSGPSKRKFVEYIANDFHAYWSNYTFYFASEPVDVGTPTDSATPVDLQWYRMETSGARGASLRSKERIWQKKTNIEANLFCAVCNNTTNPCFYGVPCRSDGSCDCNTGSSGRLCQVPPSGNGLCEYYFNTPEFSFDGGDCCQETCISEEYNCGQGMIENSAGTFAYSFIGYQNCRDPRYSSKLSGSTTLYDVIERGMVRCGSQQFPSFLEIHDGIYSGFEADLCKAIAAAALGDPEATEIIETNWVDRFNDLSDGKFDVLLGGTTFTAERDIHQSDSRKGFSFVPTPFFFDGLLFGGIPPFIACADNLDVFSPECSNLRICVLQATSWLKVTESLFPAWAIVQVISRQAEVDALEQGLCNVIAGEITLAAEFVVRNMGFTGPTYELGNNVFSKEPLSAVTQQNDRVWFKFVSWIFEALIQAEESGVTRLTANKLSTSDVFGLQFQNMFQNAVAANGNYGQVYQKNLEDRFPRAGLNRINTGASGLIYSFPFGAYENSGPGPIVGGSIEAIRRRGYLNCGVVKTPGFAELDPTTLTWNGFEVNMCQGIAAALLSGYPHVNFIPLTPKQRFKMLAEGAVDVMGWSTHTLRREVMEPSSGEGFDFTPSIFYDGMGFGGRLAFVQCAEDLASRGFESTSNCTDTRICVPSGTTWLEAMLNQLNIPVENILVTDGLDSGYEEFILGNCNVLAGESAQISESTVREKGYLASEDYAVGERKFTKEPLAIVSRSTDVQFSDFLRWIIFGFFFAAEEDITREKYFDMPINYLFGDSLSRMWQNAIQAVGNYNEMFEKNFAGVLEAGGQNMLNDRNGPQLYAKPGATIK